MTAVAEQQLTITEPGIYDLTDEQYHADPVAGRSLSSTGARKLLAPSCPAKFAWEREHGRASTKAFDFGHAAHRQVLGSGPDIVRIDADEWRTNAIKAEVAAVREAGGTPLKPADHERVMAMVDALKAHPFAGKLFAPGTGKPEKTLVWRDEQTGVMCRAKFDWLRSRAAGPYLIPDYKSAASVETEHLRKSVWNFGYHIQACWYRSGAIALGLGPDPDFLFVAQEKEPPYLVHVFRLDPAAQRAGEARCREALATYAACVKSGVWPGYADDITEISLPPWATREDF
jgi:hypothetical protein